MRSRTFAVALASVVLVAGAMLATSGSAATSFGAPVRVTPPDGHGYEPAVYTDHYGNIFATAHKENWQLALAPDLNSPTFTRSMSWAWASSDGGRSFQDLPGLSMLSVEQHDFGDEGDMSVDDANHLYFVDTNVGDITFTSWNIFGLGQYVLQQHRPVLPAGEGVDDRPWVTAHGNGHVFYFGNEGDKVTYPLGQTGCGSANGPGRYTVYQSYDGGDTFNSLGCTLSDSGWCRPAADHTAPYEYVYAICTNDGGSDDVTSATNPVGTLWSYVSADDGQNWSRYKIGNYQALDSTTSWPTVAIAPDGSIWALYVDATKLDANDDPIGNKLMLFHSTDHGKTWTSQNITPMAGRYHYSWLSISPNGKKLGVGLYYRPNASSDWHVYGAIFGPGSKPALTLLDPVSVQDKHCNTAPGDLLGSSFNPDGTLDVVWTRNTDPTTCGTVTVRDIYFARSN